MRLWIFTLALFLGISPQGVSADSFTFLPELRENFSKVICHNRTAPIFHAQISGKIIYAKDFGVLDDAKITKLALTWARHNHHPGFAYGKCSEEKAFVLSAPTAIPIKVSEQGIFISQKLLKEQCHEYFADFTRDIGGLSKQVNFLTKERIATKELARGFLSVSCVPKNIEHAGPRLLYLVPIKDPKSHIPPYRGSISDWLSQLRAMPLHENSDLQEAAKALGKNVSIDHDRNIFSVEKEKLRKLGWQILGEDRVSGQSIEDALRLLWQSPKHRDLLLDPRATDFASFLHHSSDGIFLLILTAKRLT